MTSYFPFQSSRSSAPLFMPTLDGQVYQCIVTWNIFGQRYYVNCYDGSGVRVFTVPMLETSAGHNIQMMSWDVEKRQVTAICAKPHGLRIGSVVDLTIVGCVPATYNGAYACTVLDVASFSYQLTYDPGTSVAPGSADYLISMTAGYFNTTMIFRNGQFEVSS